MRVIQQDIITALRARKNFKAGQGRDRIEWDGSEFCVILWGHHIAEGNAETATIRVSSCGYSTPTTTSRLNAVFAAFDIPVSAVIRNFNLMFVRNGKEVLNKGTKAEAGGWHVTVL
jgi:hypothetical protein